jgi:hypothetical protein
MPHLNLPVTYEYSGRKVFLKFEWLKPNDDAPARALVIQPGPIVGIGEVAAELTGPWVNYPEALAETKAAAQRWIKSQWS